MNVIYVSSLCSDKQYNVLFSENKHKGNQQIQKYHKLLVEGMIANGAEVTAVTAPSLNRDITRKKIIKLEDEKNEYIRYTYLTIINLPVIKNICVFISSFHKVILLSRKKENCIVICDVLNISVSAGALLASKMTKKFSVGIVTDLPAMLGNIIFVSRINDYINKLFDSYVFLTKQMNDVINNRNKPFVVIEGHADINMAKKTNELSQKYDKKICHYAGRLDKKYGINKLTEAFINSNVENAELHLYGNGDYVKELKELCEIQPSIKYFGIAPNNHIVNEQIKSTLLVNPRPSNEEYTKYSFPSKNMEYMASGTPVLTTKLPGMPDEYRNYVYLIEDESVEGITETLIELLNKDKLELYEKGMNAKNYVIDKKNNIVQAKKIIDLFKMNNESW